MKVLNEIIYAKDVSKAKSLIFVIAVIRSF